MLKDVLKKAYWKLPLSSEFKNKLSAKRYERILAKEAKADARGDTPVFDDAELLKEYSEYVLSSCGKRSEWYREYTEHEARKSDVTLVAYYLTQFHPNHYNDEWWGGGRPSGITLIRQSRSLWVTISRVGQASLAIMTCVWMT